MAQVTKSQGQMDLGQNSIVLQKRVNYLLLRNKYVWKTETSLTPVKATFQFQPEGKLQQVLGDEQDLEGVPNKPVPTGHVAVCCLLPVWLLF